MLVTVSCVFAFRQADPDGSLVAMFIPRRLANHKKTANISTQPNKHIELTSR